MRYKIAAALLLFAFSAILVLGGAGFACYALYAAFVPLVGNAYAAAITAAILLLVPSFGLVLLSLRARRSRLRSLEQAAAGRSPFTPSPDNVALGFLAGLTRDRPMTAVLLAGIFGAAASLFRDQK
jgi:hypothetical protein